MSEYNEAPMFPDFQQELSQEASQALAQRLGQEILQGNTANVAAGIYSRRLQVLEEKYREARERITETETDIANANARAEAAETAKPPTDLRKLDDDILVTELTNRGFAVSFPVIASQ